MFPAKKILILKFRFCLKETIKMINTIKFRGCEAGGPVPPHLFGIYRVKILKFWKIPFFISSGPHKKFASAHPEQKQCSQFSTLLLLAVNLHVWGTTSSEWRDLLSWTAIIESGLKKKIALTLELLVVQWQYKRL